MKIIKNKIWILILIYLITLLLTVFILEKSGINDSSVILGGVVLTLLFLIFGTLLLYNYSTYYKKSEQMLKSVLDAAAEAIFGIDLEGNFTFANKSCVEMLGYESEDDLIGKNMHELIHHSHLDGTCYPIEECNLLDILNETNEIHSNEELFFKADRSCFYAEYRSKPQFVEGKLIGTVISFTDITERKHSQQRIKYLYSHDAVTGLYNQTFMFEELKLLDKKANLPLSIIIGDVNGLKLTNDIFGHEAGNILLKKISEAIRRSCRADDIIARVGGDEFVILLPKTSSVDAHIIMKRIKNETEKEEYKAVKGSIALGYATKTKQDDDIAELLKEAEEDMYKNKSLEQKNINADQFKRIINALHEKSQPNKIHSINVSRLCERIAVKMGLNGEEIKRAKDAGYYHDIGKIAVSEQILNKIHLDDEENVEMKKHSIIGYRILNLFDETIDIAKGVLDHHELYNGTGYPKALKEDEISLLGRIIAVAEAYDYRTNPHSIAKLCKADAINEIKENAGIKFDPQVVKAFVKVMRHNSVYLSDEKRKTHSAVLSGLRKKINRL